MSTASATSTRTCRPRNRHLPVPITVPAGSVRRAQPPGQAGGLRESDQQRPGQSGDQQLRVDERRRRHARGTSRRRCPKRRRSACRSVARTATASRRRTSIRNRPPQRAMRGSRPRATRTMPASPTLCGLPATACLRSSTTAASTSASAPRRCRSSGRPGTLHASSTPVVANQLRLRGRHERRQRERQRPHLCPARRV